MSKHSVDKYQKTKKGIVTVIYNSQKQSSKRRGHPMPSYTLKELRQWMYSQKEFHELYDQWKASGYDRWLKPSCDRLDDYKPYTLDNLQVVAWKDNFSRSHKDRLNGVNNKASKSVLQFTLDGEFVAEHYSLHNAERQTGVSFKSISKVCNGEYSYAGGYVWEFKQY